MKKLMILSLISIVPLISFAADTLPQITCQESKVPLFKSSEVIELSMKGQFPVTPEAAPAEIIYKDSQSNLSKNIPINIVSRGKSRTSCTFDPIRIVWTDKKDEVIKDTIFDKIKGSDMKLTVHCSYTDGLVEQNQEANEIILKEYMIYKILKAFNLPAYDVRLTKMNYVDAQDKLTVQGMGFFIESSAQLGKRCNLTHAKSAETVAAVGAEMNKQIYMPYLFSRLITDARDFVIEYQGGHNSEPFFDANKVTQVIVPYDFNDSGQVNSGIAPYWSFTPNMDAWFNMLRKGPFTRDSVSIPLNETEQAAWNDNLIIMANKLILQKDAVLKVIDESPLMQKSKDDFHLHIEMLIGQFQKIIAENGIVNNNIPAPNPY